MDEPIIKLPRIASPTIDEVFDAFLAEQRQRLQAKTARTYVNVIDLLRSYLNGYAHEDLLPPETILFERHYNAEGEQRREFCQVFGPDKVPASLGMFLDTFMIRKVTAGAAFKKAAGTVTKKLSKWLADNGHIAAAVAAAAAGRAAAAARDLPKAERAADLLMAAADRVDVDLDELADEDYIDFDHYTITRIEPGKLWLDVYFEEELAVGPIPVPKAVTSLLKENWDVSCALGRVNGTWRIVEAANVYPV